MRRRSRGAAEQAVPVQQMIAASRAIGRSKFDIPDIPLPKQPEIAQLAESFNIMKHSMAQQMTTLQEKNEIERELHRQKTEALELQNRMERSRLQQLRSQIDPHFLFNTLNVIQQMAGTEKSRSRAEGGSGIGLALCARIANAHGAKLEITSTEHVGTTVTIAVPEVLPSEREADNDTQS